jgi:hypothetical protein
MTRKTAKNLKRTINCTGHYDRKLRKEISKELYTLGVPSTRCAVVADAIASKFEAISMSNINQGLSKSGSALLAYKSDDVYIAKIRKAVNYSQSNN